MALGSGWWGGDWRLNRLPSAAAFEASTITLSTISDLWQALRVAGEYYLYQRDYSFNGNHDFDDGGGFYINNIATGELTPAADSFKELNPYADTMLPEAETQGEIEPFDENQAVLYADPFSVSPTYPSTWNATLTNKPPAASGDTFSVVHRCPWAWHGSPSQVIASLLISLGIASAWIDTTAVDNAYDGEEADHGAAGINKPRIRAVRQVGKPIIDLIKRIAAHSWTRIGYTMSGKFACWSTTRPTTYAASGLAGIKGTISWGITDAHLYNVASATHGSVSRSTAGGAGVAPTIVDAGAEVPNPEYKFQSAWDPTISSARSDRWLDTDSNSSSEAAFGAIALGGIDEGGNPQPVHYEQFYDAASPIGVLARVDKFCQPLREVVLTQDLSGLDYEVGTLITDYETGDGVTADYFCIAKEIDFNTLTVTSTLLEDLA